MRCTRSSNRIGNIIGMFLWIIFFFQFFLTRLTAERPPPPGEKSAIERINLRWPSRTQSILIYVANIWLKPVLISIVFM